MLGKERVPLRMVRENYWIPVRGRLQECTEPILDAVRWSERNEHGIKGLKDEYFIYQNETETYHSGRFRVNERSFTPQFRETIKKNRYDVVFLLIGERNRQYVVKFPQTRDNKEWEMAREMSSLKIGPTVLKTQFPIRIQKYKGKLIIEDCLSRAHGWRPLHMIWRNVKRRKWFVEEFGQLLRKMHENEVVYLENFYDHLFINSSQLKVKLIDFGVGERSKDNSDRDIDIEMALRFLKTEMVPPEKQEQFLKIYSKGFRQVDFRTNTMIKGGREIAYRRR